MVNLDQLTRRGLRAYEIGRLRSASWAAAYVVPLIVLCALETRAGETCACLGILLLGVSVFLRWRDRRGLESVTTGLAAGSLVLFSGLILARMMPECANAPFFSLCTAICLAVGVVAGGIMALHGARGRADLVSWSTSTGIAVLAASLGCLRLGVAGVVGSAVGLFLGGAISAVAVRVPPTR